MSMYFLAGVGNAEIFNQNDELFATARALTDSSITIGVNAEEVRGGEGAALRGKYFHSSSFGLRMTSAMFNLEYIAANVGAKIEEGADVITYKEVKTDSTKLVLPTPAVPLGKTVYAYASLVGEDNYKTYPVSAEDNSITVPVAGTYCVKYFENNIGARKIKINSNFIPDTLYVVLTCALYAGDAKSGTGTKVGSMVIKVPRFQLNGSQELGMTMTGASTTNFEGSALAIEDGCDGQGYYAEIIEVLTNARWYDNVRSIQIEDNDVEVTATGEFTINPEVYAIYSNALPKKISNAIIAAGEGSIPSGEKSSLVFTTVPQSITGLTVDASLGTVTGTTSVAAGTYTVRVEAQKNGVKIPDLDATMAITVKK